MGLFDFLKKKGLSPKSVNFARLVKTYCLESGIPVQLQLNITKAIARDFIDKKGRSIADFIFMAHESAKSYLMQQGLSDMDAEIFLNILTTNKDGFINI